MMKIREFVKKVRIGDKISVCGEQYTILDHVKWHMLRSDLYYNKYTLRDKGDGSYKFAEDPDSGGYLLVKHFTLNEKGPFLPEYTVEGKRFRFLGGEICVAAEVEGEGHQKKGDYDIWWDYETGDGSYMSLGCDKDGNRADLIGKRVMAEDVEILKN